jgi:hypothetical protein
VVNGGFLLLVQLESGCWVYVEDEYLPTMKMIRHIPGESVAGSGHLPFGSAFFLRPAMVEVGSALDGEVIPCKKEVWPKRSVDCGGC